MHRNYPCQTLISMMPPKKGRPFYVHEIPLIKRRQLKEIIDYNGGWEHLVENLDGFSLTHLNHLKHSQSIGHSPTDKILVILDKKNYLISQLFRVLINIDQRQAAEVIQDLVDPELQRHLQGEEDPDLDHIAGMGRLGHEVPYNKPAPQPNPPEKSHYSGNTAAQNMMSFDKMTKEKMVVNLQDTWSQPSISAAPQPSRYPAPQHQPSHKEPIESPDMSQSNFPAANSHLTFNNTFSDSSRTSNYVSDLSCGHNSQTSSQPHLTIFTYEEITEATKDFHKDYFLGSGAFGKVYKGTLRGSSFAIKCFHENIHDLESTSRRHLAREMSALVSCRHANIVLLCGYCPNPELCLVYEYMIEGSLMDKLDPKNPKPLTWPQRSNILRGAARAIHFLHVSKPPLIHGDIKSSNILLDKHLEAKIADFGLARAATGGSQTGILTHVTRTKSTQGIFGSKAYLPLECLRDPKFLCHVKTDVYSYGVVLFEVCTGRRAEYKKKETVFLRDEVHDANEVDEMKKLKMKDPNISDCPDTIWITVLQVGLECTADNKRKRPDMEKVLRSLEVIEAEYRNKRVSQHSESDGENSTGLPTIKHPPTTMPSYSQSSSVKSFKLSHTSSPGVSLHEAYAPDSNAYRLQKSYDQKNSSKSIAGETVLEESDQILRDDGSNNNGHNTTVKILSDQKPNNMNIPASPQGSYPESPCSDTKDDVRSLQMSGDHIIEGPSLSRGSSIDKQTSDSDHSSLEHSASSQHEIVDQTYDSERMEVEEKLRKKGKKLPFLQKKQNISPGVDTVQPPQLPQQPVHQTQVSPVQILPHIYNQQRMEEVNKKLGGMTLQHQLPEQAIYQQQYYLQQQGYPPYMGPTGQINPVQYQHFINNYQYYTQMTQGHLPACPISSPRPGTEVSGHIREGDSIESEEEIQTHAGPAQLQPETAPQQLGSTQSTADQTQKYEQYAASTVTSPPTMHQAHFMPTMHQVQLAACPQQLYVNQFTTDQLQKQGFSPPIVTSPPLMHQQYVNQSPVMAVTQNEGPYQKVNQLAQENQHTSSSSGAEIESDEPKGNNSISQQNEQTETRDDTKCSDQIQNCNQQKSDLSMTGGSLPENGTEVREACVPTAPSFPPTDCQRMELAQGLLMRKQKLFQKESSEA